MGSDDEVELKEAKNEIRKEKNLLKKERKAEKELKQIKKQTNAVALQGSADVLSMFRKNPKLMMKVRDMSKRATVNIVEARKKFVTARKELEAAANEARKKLQIQRMT